MDKHNKQQCAFDTGKRHCWSEICEIHIFVPNYFCSSECQDEYWSVAEKNKKHKKIKDVIASMRSRVKNPIPLESTLSENEIEEIFSKETEEAKSINIPQRLFSGY